MSGIQIKGPQNILRKNKTEPDKLSRFHSSDMRGPFKYEPLQNISHPIQPEDDVSVRDPTLRTVDKSKLSQSLYQNNSIRSKTPISEPDESPFMLTFPQKQLETTRKRSKSKLITYFIERIRKRFKIDSKAKQFQYLFDQETNSKDYNWTLLPSSWILQVWNLTFYLILNLMIVYVPLSTSLILKDLNYVFLVFKCLDVGMQLCSSFTENGQFITNFKLISMRYNKQLLLHDSITIIGLTFLNTLSSNFKFYVLTAVLLSLIKRFYEIEIHLKFEFNLFHPIVLVINSIIKMILIFHVITCYQYGLFDQYHEQFASYLSSLNVIVSIYAFNSNYVPDEQEELLFNCLINFSAIIMFAYFLTQFMYLFKSNRISEQLSEFLAINKLDSNLKFKITNHIFNQPKFYHNQFISKLSGKLLQEFNYIQRSQLLTKYFKFYNQHTINTLINYCEDMICQPNQVIVTESEHDDCSLYFILEGNFKVVNKMGVQLQILGVFEIIINSQPKLLVKFPFTLNCPDLQLQQVKASADCQESEGKSSLNCQHLVTKYKFRLFNKQYFYNLKDRILIHKDMPCLCFCCQQSDHLVTKCPLLTYRPDKEKVIKTYIYPMKNLRKKFDRKLNREIKALDFLKDAEANQDYLLQLYSDNHFQSSNQFSQSNLPYDDVYIKDSYASAQSFSRVSREKSLLKSTSLLKEKSIYEQQQSLINDVFLETADNQYIVHQGELDDDKFVSLVRKDQQKNTFATAGFGNLGQQSIKDQKSLNVIIENESSENSPSLENVLEQSNQLQRNKDPKLTFNYNFDNQMSELQNKYQQYQRNVSESINNSVLRQENRQTSIRQNSSRSQTYSPLTSNNITANSYRSQIKQNENTQTPSGKPRRSSNSNYTVRSISGINRQYTDSPELQSRKGTNRKKSTRTGTKVSVAPSQFQPFSGFDNPVQTEFGDNDFEKLYLFEVYLPYNNYDIVIYKFNQYNKQKRLKKLSKYFLSFKLAVQIQRLKAKQQYINYELDKVNNDVDDDIQIIY